MSFSIDLYTTNSKRNKIGKTLTDKKTITGLWQEQTSILHPIFRIKHNEDVLTRYTYCYISKFKRYYFIEDRRPDNGVYDIITLSVDPLESYKDEILASTQIIGRQENNFNLYLIDSNITTTNNEVHDIITFPNKKFETDGSVVNDSSKIFTVSVLNNENIPVGG